MGKVVMRSSFWLVGFLGLGCSAGERAAARPPVPVPRAVVAQGLREADAVEIAVRGQYPRLEFHFIDCTTGRPPTWITEITIVRENRTVCTVTSPDKSLPPIWAYDASGGMQSENKCEALTPGLYGIKLYGGEKGRAEFEIAEDGTVSVKGLTCATMGSDAASSQ